MISKSSPVNKKGSIFLRLLNLSPSHLFSLCEFSIIFSETGGFMTLKSVLLEAENCLPFTVSLQNICKS